MGMHKNAFTVDVNEELSNSFSSQVEERAYTKYRAIEGALRLFMALDPGRQVALMSPEGDKAAEDIVQGSETIQADLERNFVPVKTHQIERKRRQGFEKVCKELLSDPQLSQKLKDKIQSRLESLQRVQKERQIRPALKPEDSA